MPDTKPSAFTADSTPDDTDWLPYIDRDEGGAGVHGNNILTFSELVAYIEGRGRQNNASVANQGAGFATDTYLTGSYVTIPTNPAGGNRLQAKSKYRLRFNATKTAAGTATPIINVRLGTAGTTADTSRLTLTHAAQTAVIDEMVYDLSVVFRTVGSGTSAVIAGIGVLDHRLASTGFANVNTSIQQGVSAGFDSTVASLGIGVSVNGGTSAAWTVNLVEAELYNLA